MKFGAGGAANAQSVLQNYLKYSDFNVHAIIKII